MTTGGGGCANQVLRSDSKSYDISCNARRIGVVMFVVDGVWCMLLRLYICTSL